MSQVEVSSVSCRKDRNAFIRFPWQIYKDDAAWVPPLILERVEPKERQLLRDVLQVIGNTCRIRA